MNVGFLVDKEVETVLRITRKTLIENLANGPKTADEIDLRKAAPFRIGRGEKRQRRWPLARFAEVVGMTEENILGVLN